MFKTIAIVAALLLPSVAAAAPSEASCLETANTNYLIALEIGAPDADMVHEDTYFDCWESQDHALVKRELTANRPISYAGAIEAAHDSDACYIEQVKGGWIVVQECDAE